MMSVESKTSLYGSDEQCQLEKEKAKHNPSWDLTPKQLLDIELLLSGAFYPLQGYMGQQDYQSVLASLRLSSADYQGQIWPMPINLDVTEDFAANLKLGDEVTLRDQEGVVIANLTVSDIWQPNKKLEAEKVFNSTDDSHFGVHQLLHESNPVYLGGKLVGVTPPLYYDFVDARKTPDDLKSQLLKDKESNQANIAVPNSQLLHKSQIEAIDSLLTASDLLGEMNSPIKLVIQAATGITEPGNVDHFTRMRCYEKALSHLSNKTMPDQVSVNLLPIAMRMSGKREVLWQILIQQNYGFSHVLLNQEQADLYADLDLVDLDKELKIKLITDERIAKAMVPELSIQQVTDLLRKGQPIPEGISYPEIIEELAEIIPPLDKQGFTLFFTGLSGSGKSTLANGVMVKLKEISHRQISLLDGDVVRKNLSSELNFSKEHRDINIRRIGYVASEITKNGGIAICAPIAPYAATRAAVRSEVEAGGQFIEIHVSTPIEVCEARDRKGFYAMARAGKITGFTGIDDPYHTPVNPELRVDTSQYEMKEAVNVVIEKLYELGLLIR